MSNEIIVHSWEWKRPTKYVEKYQDKKGNWVYVYDNGIKNKGSRPYRLGERNQNKKPSRSEKKYIKSNFFDTQNKDDSYAERKSIGKSKIYVDKRDNMSSAKKLEEDIPNADSSFINSVLNKIGIDTSPEFIDLETGRKMSRTKVNAYAALNTIRTSAAKAYGKAYVSLLSSAANLRIRKNFSSLKKLDSPIYNSIQFDSEEVSKYKKYFDGFGSNGYSFDRIIEMIYKDMKRDSLNTFNAEIFTKQEEKTHRI